MDDKAQRLETLLRAVPFFSALNRVHLARLVGALEEVKYSASELIFEEGSPADALYLVEQGRVRVAVRSSQGDIKLTVIDEGAHFGEFGLLLGRRTASAIAQTDVTLWKLPRERCAELVRESPGLALRAAAALAALLDRRSRASVGAPLPLRDPTLSARASVHAWTPRMLRGLAIALGVPLALWWAPLPTGLTAQGWHVILIVLGAAIGWLLEPLPDFIVTLLMATAWGITGLAPLPLIFGGFATSAWLLGLSALAVAAAMVRSGLMFRASLAVLRRFPATHRGQVLALLTGGILITPLVPLAIGRVAAIAPFAREVARGLHYPERGPGSASLALAGIIGYGAFSGVFLTGLAMNFFVLDLLPPPDRLQATWLNWFARAMPSGLVLWIGSALFLLFWFRPGRASAARHVEHQQHILGRLSSREKVTIVALVVLLIGFLIQPLLKLNPAWPAIGAMAVAVGGGSLTREFFRRAIDWGFLVQFGILLGAGNVLSANGVDAWIAARLVRVIGEGWPPAALLFLLAAFVVVCRLVIPWIPATLLLSLAFVPAAASLGLNPWVTGFVVIVTANTWLHPNQSDYCRVARDTGGELFVQQDAFAAGVAMTILTLLGVAIAIPYWWLLGIL
jgi:DASS family divalent anion:Na+ symporter